MRAPERPSTERLATAVAGLVGGLPVQRKLAVGAAHDPCEHEADQVARDIVAALRGSSAPAVAGSAGSGGETDAADQGRVDAVRALRRTDTIGAAGGELDRSSEDAIRAARGSGRPLDSGVRSQIEPLLGADLSAVRLHSGPQAKALNEGMQARAFTVGSDVFFHGGIPDTRSNAGLELLAHELTHTVQQTSSVGRALVAPTSIQRNGGTTTAPSGPAPSGPSDRDIETALDKFATCDGKKVAAAIGAYASKKKDSGEERDLGMGFSGKGKIEGGAQVGAFGGIEVRELENAYAVLAEAGLVAGASIKIEGELKRKFGKLAVKAKGTFSAFVGAMVKAYGKVMIGADGISLEGSAKGLAGVESVQNGSLQFGVGDYGVKAEAEAREMAGAEFDAEGSFALKKGEIALGGSFSAFAGAKVDGKVKTSGTLYGRDAVSLELTGSAKAGAGASAKGEFSIKRGVLKVKLGGDLAVGLGGGGGANLMTDFKPIAVWIIRKAYRQYWKSHQTEADDVLANPDKAKQGIIDDLAEYGKFKRQQLSLGKADNYVKEEKIQQYVNKHVPRAMVKKHSNASAIDQMIKEAVEEAFTEGGVKTVEVTVKDGKVKVTKSKPASEYAKAKNVVTSEKTGKGLMTVTSSSKG